MKKTLFFIVLFACYINNAIAQEDCKVLMAPISVKYEGECKNGKAQGIGNAKGEDAYQGQFSNGLPDGMGKYTWKNGSFYDGSFKKGKKEGQGMMTFKLEEKADSIVAGFWKNDKYVGLYEKPFIIHYKSSAINRASISRIDGSKPVFQIIVTNSSGGIPTLRETVLEKLTVSSFDLIKGSYFDLQRIEKGKEMVTILRDVTYPLRLKAYIGRDVIDVELLEPGSYAMNVFINL